MRFLHAADIHLDSPLSGLAVRAGERAAELIGATRRAFVAMIDTAIARRVDCVLIAGDLYDVNWRDFSTGLFFVEGMGRLVRAGIRVAMVWGNHDAQNDMTRTLTLPPEIHVFGSQKAETIRWENLRVALHGRSFATRQERENIAQDYPKAVDGFFNIGLLHTSASGRDGHDVYAPCSLDDLIQKRYDYWALGHVHAREELCRDPWIVYPGNLQGRHVNEAGAKGCTLVTVDDALRVTTVEALALDVVRWAHCLVDVSPFERWEEVAAAVRAALASEAAAAEGRTLAVRVTLTGTSTIHRQLIGDPERTLAECSAAAALIGDIWIERVKIESQDPSTTASGDGAAADALAELMRTIAAIQATPEERDLLRAQFSKDLEKIPLSIRKLVELDTLSDEEKGDKTLNDILKDAHALLLDRLLGDTRLRESGSS